MALVLVFLLVVHSAKIGIIRADDGALARNEILRRTLPAYGLAAASSNNTDEPVSKCREQLDVFRRAVEDRYLWALKVLDASGEPKPGFVYGNNYWLGVRSQCLDVGNRKPLVLQKNYMEKSLRSREFPPFEVHYFVAYFRNNSTLQYHVRLPNEDLVSLGLCLPSSCSTREIGHLLSEMFRERSLMFAEMYSADLRLVEVKDLKDDHKWLFTERFFIFTFIVLSIFTLMLIGTIYDVSMNYGDKSFEIIKDPETGGKNHVEMIKLNDNNNETVLTIKTVKPSCFGKLLLCFSVYSNAKLIFNPKVSSESIVPIHGLRFLGMLWIIMIHTVFYMSDYVDNKAYSWKLADGFFMQLISNSTYSVDTFFFLSGFLLAYMYINAHWNIGRKHIYCGLRTADFILSVIRRFIRLTPTYVMMMSLIQLSSSLYGSTSQFYMTERPQETCEKYWWRNLLYINNLFGRETMCMSWSWYLSNDMQFFIIGDLLLILSSTYFSAAIVILLLLLFGSTFITGYIAYVNNYVPTMDMAFHMLDTLYDPPWTRIGPYIVGILTAFIVKKLNKKLTVQKRTIVLCWLFGGACNLVVLFGLYERQLPVLVSAIYVALSRTVWAIGMAWLLIACCTNHGGIVNKVLCFKAWIPLSRLTYCAYLLNPFLINLIYLQSESARHMDFLPNFTMFLGNLVITYCCSFLLSLMLETPTILIMRTFLSVKRYESR